MPRRRYAAVLATVSLAAGAFGACGGSEAPSGPDYRLVTPPPYVGAEPIAVPTPGVEVAMHAKDVERLGPVIEAWSEKVRAGRFAAAAKHFALPVIVANPSTGPLEIRTREAVVAFNRAFPCAARFLSASAHGRYIVGTFRLESMAGRTCTALRALARVGFVFGDRKRPKRFTEWWRVSDAPNAEIGPSRRPAAPIAGPGSFR
jgi:hypothetical protein